jgi:hypothetical protein
MPTGNRRFFRLRFWIGGPFLRWSARALVAATVPLVACSSAPPTSVESTATASSELAISGLFATGVDGSGTPLATGATDTHYVLSSLDPFHLGPNAIAVGPVGGWVGATSTSKWISVQANANGNSVTYTYTASFTLTGVDPTTASLSGTWACDDSCTLLLNGAQVASLAVPGFGATTNFTVGPNNANFVTGTNVLSFVTVNSGGGPTGLLVTSLTGSAGCTVDTQCTAAQFCNTQSGACTGKLPNSTAIPTLTGHTPALTGTCTTTVGAAVCTSALCGSNNECGLANGEGPCVAKITAAPECQSGSCSTNLTCEPAGGCNADADCNTATQYCAASTHLCTGKLPNGTAIPNDPGHVNPPLAGLCTTAAATAVCTSGVCDTADNACGIATGDPGCTVAAAGVCRSGSCSLLGTCEPMGGCNEDADCPSGQWCKETAHTCNAKLATLSPIPDDPPHTNPTLDAMCTPQAATLVCQSGLCNTTTNTCVECTSSNTSACMGLTLLCGATGLCIAGTPDGGVDGGSADAGGDSGTDAGTDAGVTDGGDAGIGAAGDGGPTDASADASGDASDGATAEAGDDGGDDASEGSDATTQRDAAGGGSSSGGSSSSGAGTSGELEGGGLSCSVSWARSQESCGGTLLMLAIASGAAFGRRRRNR